MLRSSRSASHGSLILFQAPTRRQRIARRRTVAVTAILALALASGIVGAIASRGGEAQALAGVHKTPLSYLPL